MLRKMLMGVLVGSVVVLVAAIFAPRFDQTELWLSGAPTLPTAKRTPNKAKAASLPSLPASGSNQTSAPEGAKFDVVRIDPEGASVFAGRAPANAQVIVLANGEIVATTKA